MEVFTEDRVDRLPHGLAEQTVVVEDRVCRAARPELVGVEAVDLPHSEVGYPHVAQGRPDGGVDDAAVPGQGAGPDAGGGVV